MRTRPYRHKLNLLEPGIWICRSIGAAGLAGILFYAVGLRLAAYILWGAAGLAALVLFILLCVERHQDRVMAELARREDAAAAVRSRF